MRIYTHFLLHCVLVSVALLLAKNAPVSLAQEADRHTKMSHPEPNNNYRTRPKQAGNRVVDRLDGNDQQPLDRHGDDAMKHTSNVRTQEKDGDTRHQQHDEDYSAVQLRDGRYHIAVPQQREGPDHDASGRDGESDFNGQSRHPDVHSISTKHQNNNQRQHQPPPPRHSNQPPQDRVENSPTQENGGARVSETKNKKHEKIQRVKNSGGEKSNDLTDFRMNSNPRHEHPLQDPTGDGNIDYNGKEEVAAKVDPGSSSGSRTSSLQDPTGDGNMDYNGKEEVAAKVNSGPSSGISRTNSLEDPTGDGNIDYNGKEEVTSQAAKHSSRDGNDIHDPTGDGNVDYNTKEEKDMSPIYSSREEEDDSKNKMVVVYCSVAFFVLVSFYQLNKPAH